MNIYCKLLNYYASVLQICAPQEIDKPLKNMHFILTNTIIIQHIDTLPKYGQKTLDVCRST